MSWQKPARIGVAIIGLASAGAVYFAMGERRSAPPPKPVERLDSKATVETCGSLFKQFSGAFKDFEITADCVFSYEDGSLRLVGKAGEPLTILVHKGEKRTVRITAAETTVNKDQNYFELTGPMRLQDVDGFWIEAEKATINRTDSITHIPGSATFGKGRMSGSGVGFSYDSTREILLISKQTRVKTVNEAGKTVVELASDTAMLDKLQHLLALDTGVHVVRDEQTIDADHANGRLSQDNDVVTFIELHGNSRVSGGASIDALTARDINLDYTEDGQTLEAVKMAGSATAAMAGEDGRQGRRIVGETVDLVLAADGKLTSAIARENVRLELPAGVDTPPRTITAQALDGTGQAGKGLTSVTFTRDVTFTEGALRSKGSASDKQGAERTAQSQKLDASLADDAVTSATFSGGVAFEETGLKACSAQAEYQPQKGFLKLAGATKEGNPIVAQEQVVIEGLTIDVELDTRKMSARRDVKAWMRSSAVRRCRPARARSTEEQGANNVPRLLKADAPVTILATNLDYDSKTGYAEFSGRSTLEQQETAISGDKLVIDQTKGDLSATGRATSKLMIDDKIMTGKADEIRYSDERRLISFSTAPKAGSGEVSLIPGPESSLRAVSRIDITLAAKDNTLDKMRAQRNVRIVEGSHTVTGGDTLDYNAADEKYVVRGTATTPVIAITRDNATNTCRQSGGRTIEFFKGKDAVMVDGKGTSQASTAPSKSPCSPSTR